MTPAEVQYLLSAPNASAGYLSPGSVYNSNGTYCSTTQVNTTVAQNNLFPDITGPENAAGQVDYQCLFIFNSDAVTTMQNVFAWIPNTSVTSNAISWAIGLDVTGVSNYNATSIQAVTIANPTTAPASVPGWVGPSASSSGGISLGSIGPRQVYPIWVRRSATGLGALSAAFNLQVTFGA